MAECEYGDCAASATQEVDLPEGLEFYDGPLTMHYCGYHAKLARKAIKGEKIHG